MKRWFLQKVGAGFEKYEIRGYESFIKSRDEIKR
jgi:hypothetical protein